ncbi:MAG: pseudouridine synthase [Christensenellales bacterium]|jgi:pseudouridine synthase
MRLQKYLAEAGVASRRKCEEYIQAGRVSVNGSIVTELGTKVQEGDTVCFDGKPLKLEKKVCILFYKPSQVMCTNSDPQGRPTVLDYFKHLGLRLFTVGRLDYDTEGLILVTNDGELANQLAHPRHEVKKTYYVVCRGKLSREALQRLREGVEIDGKRTAPAKVKVISSNEKNTRLHITLHEGRNRQVRKMCYAVGHDVSFLRRESVGGLDLSGLRPGEWRYLTPGEIQALVASSRPEKRIS